MPIYTCRRNLLEKQTTYRLGPAGVEIEPQAGVESTIGYDAIREIRLAFVPTKSAPNRFECQIHSRGHALVLSNVHFEGFASFEERSEAYRAFVEGLHERLAEAAPAVRYRRGTTTLWYVFNLAFGWFGLLAMTVIAVLSALTVPYLIVLYLLALFFIGRTMWRYTTSNYPRPYDPLAIPDAILPAIGPPAAKIDLTSPA